MNRFLSALSIMSLLLQPYAAITSSAHAQAPINLPTQASLSDQRTFKLDQETNSFELEHKEIEAVYETQQQPDTCYRQVQRGMKTECHTEYDQQCSTRNETECQNIPYPVCADVNERVCEDVPRRSCQTVSENVCETVNDSVCHTEDQRVCQNVPRRECHQEQVCTTVNEQVCNANFESNAAVFAAATPPPTRGGSTGSRGDGPTRGSDGPTRGGSTGPVSTPTPRPQPTCHNVPRQSCSNVDRCTTVNDSVCHTEPRQVCQNVPRRQCHVEPRQSCTTVYDNVCHSETRQQCHDEYRRECQQVPRETCVDVPRQACEQVPNMQTESYACTKPVQVKVGERTKLQVNAIVKVQVVNFGKIEMNDDEFNASIEIKRDAQNVLKTGVKLTLGKNNKKVLYRLLKSDVNEQVISATEKRLLANFQIELMSLDQLSAMNELKIVDQKLSYKNLEFKLAHPTLGSNIAGLVTFDKSSLKLVSWRKNKYTILIDDKFDPALVLQKTETGYAINFSSFKIQSLLYRNHDVRLELNFKSSLNRTEFLNPELLTTVSIKPVIAEFEAYPVE